MNSPIKKFFMRLSEDYTNDLALPATYKYLGGEAVRPVISANTAQDGVFIIGAYPTARFSTIGSLNDVPVGDISAPFSNETYRDGHRIREVKSGVELDDHYLNPLGISREQCWITNLVKLFLFKEGHIKKYRMLGYPFPEFETRCHFEDYVHQGMSWLFEEIDLAAPRVIITLGAEVAGVLQGVKGRINRNKLLGGDLKHLELGSRSYPVIHFAHPGILMRPALDKSGRERNPWPRLHLQKHIPEARRTLALCKL